MQVEAVNKDSISTTAKARGSFRHGLAWMALSLAMAVHVIDETLHDFLSFYNPAVHAIREKLPFLPLPTFTFHVWLAGLIVAVVLLLFLSIFAFRVAGWMRPLSYVYGIINTFNGLLHIAASIYLGRAVPGVYSSPLLLVCSVYLLLVVWKAGKPAEAA